MHTKRREEDYGNRQKTTHVVVTRPVRANVAQMLDSVYDILGNQIGMLKTRATIDELDSKDAAKLHKYALTLTLLREEEEKRTQAFGLQGYSDDEIQQLVAKSEKLLGSDTSK